MANNDPSKGQPRSVLSPVLQTPAVQLLRTTRTLVLVWEGSHVPRQHTVPGTRGETGFVEAKEGRVARQPRHRDKEGETTGKYNTIENRTRLIEPGGRSGYRLDASATRLHSTPLDATGSIRRQAEDESKQHKESTVGTIGIRQKEAMDFLVFGIPFDGTFGENQWRMDEIIHDQRRNPRV